MSGRIVVGIDGSEHSGGALAWAVARARLGGEPLELVHAYSPVPAVPTGDLYGLHDLAASQTVEWYAELADQLLDAAAGRVRELAPELTCTTSARPGQPGPVLMAASEEADAVVIGRRGLGSAVGALLGSVSNQMATDATCPVVVVGEGEVPTTGPIVVGVDESQFGISALRFAIDEAALRGTSVRAVTAYDVLQTAGFRADPELVERLQADVEGGVADLVDRVLGETPGGAEVAVEHVAAHAEAAPAILGHAGNAQLIVVGTHGKGLVRRVLLGSVSRDVLHGADRPVAVVDVGKGLI